MAFTEMLERIFLSSTKVVSYVTDIKKNYIWIIYFTKNYQQLLKQSKSTEIDTAIYMDIWPGRLSEAAYVKKFCSTAVGRLNQNWRTWYNSNVAVFLQTCGKHVKIDKFMQICTKNYIHGYYRWLLSHYCCMNVQYILIYTCEHTNLLHFLNTLFFTQILQYVIRR